MQRKREPFCRAYTLIELSIVVLVLALLAGAAMRYANAINEAKTSRDANATLDIVETALQNYRNMYGRLPCPSDLTVAESAAGFGTEVGTAGDGNCSGANYTNSTTDPDASGGSDPGAPDTNYDSATASKVVFGGVPTRTLRLADRYAYDSWGRKIFYAVDKRITATSAFTTYSISNSVVGAVVVKKTGTDTLANALTYKALYALVTTGKNGHGGYARNVSGTQARVNAGSVNADQLVNCHCTSAAVAASFTRIFVQKPKTMDYSTSNDDFDDIVRYKRRSDMATTAELQ